MNIEFKFGYNDRVRVIKNGYEGIIINCAYNENGIEYFIQNEGWYKEEELVKVKDFKYDIGDVVNLISGNKGTVVNRAHMTRNKQYHIEEIVVISKWYDEIDILKKM